MIKKILKILVPIMFLSVRVSFADSETMEYNDAYTEQYHRVAGWVTYGPSTSTASVLISSYSCHFDTNLGIGITDHSIPLYVVGNSTVTGNMTLGGIYYGDGSGLTDLNVTTGTLSGHYHISVDTADIALDALDSQLLDSLDSTYFAVYADVSADTTTLRTDINNLSTAVNNSTTSLQSSINTINTELDTYPTTYVNTTGDTMTGDLIVNGDISCSSLTVSAGVYGLVIGTVTYADDSDKLDGNCGTELAP